MELIKKSILERRDLEKRYFYFLDNLRALAVCLVTLAHLGGWWLGSIGTSIVEFTIYSRITEKLLLYQSAGHLAVLIFFLISGYIIAHVTEYEDTRIFIIKRFFRIFPPLIVCILAMCVIVAVSRAIGIRDPLGMKEFSFRSVVATMLLVSRPLGIPDFLSVTWTLVIEFAYYIMCSFCMLSPRKTTRIIGIYLLALASAVIGMLHAPFREFSIHLVYVLFILVGHSIYYMQVDHKRRFFYGSIGLLSFCSFLAIYDRYFPQKIASLPAVTLASYCIAIATFCFAMKWLTKTTRFISYLSTISYSLYLYHVPIGSFVAYYIFSCTQSARLAVFAAIGMSIVVAHVANKLIEVPSQKMARRFISRITNDRDNRIAI
jgi:peptidoglycan/LPS O-acetylase OafA/YrhL